MPSLKCFRSGEKEDIGLRDRQKRLHRAIDIWFLKVVWEFTDNIGESIPGK